MSEGKNQEMRRLIELAVTAGRRRQSTQTGYLHHFYSSPLEDEKLGVTIPLLENALFALALLRSRTVENGMEAKSLLEKLLHFQHPKGNFPIYLHEYPECKDRFVSAHLALPFFWILKTFQQILGSDLKKKLEEALIKGLQHALEVLKEKEVSYTLTLKVAAAAKATGEFLHHHEMEQEGERLLNNLLLVGENSAAWYSPAQLGSILSSLQLVFPKIESSPWRSFWKHLENTWHRRTCSYIGPGVKEYQVEFEPQVTLYDLYLGYFSGQFSERALKENLIHLEGALIQPSDEVINAPSLSLKGKIKEAKWSSVHHEGYGYSLLEKGDFLNPAMEKAFHPFKLLWGNSNCTHTLVCQGGNSKKVEWTQVDKGIDFRFYLNDPVLSEEREKNREINFFLDLDDEIKMRIAGQQASTFVVGDLIEITCAEYVFTVQFTLEEGEGHFFGHFMQGNRPSQLCQHSSKSLKAYDWQLFLRCVNRHGPCMIKVSLRWNHIDV